MLRNGVAYLRRGNVWTDEKLALAIRLKGEGVEAAEIGKRVGKSKNAVIGKLNREKKEPVPDVFEFPSHSSAPEPWMCAEPQDVANKFGHFICGRTVQPGRRYCATHIREQYTRWKNERADQQ